MTSKSTLLFLIVLSVGAGACSSSGHAVNSLLMADGKYWTTENVNVATTESYCYDSLKSNCKRYGRLYTWKSATKVCTQLGEGWRLPGNEDWKGLAKPYGGVWDDSMDGGKKAYTTMTAGGSSQFNALLSGSKDPDGKYRRMDGHGLYWTSTETSDSTAWFYNFGRGKQFLNRHSDGEKDRGFAVRCVKNP